MPRLLFRIKPELPIFRPGYRTPNRKTLPQQIFFPDYKVALVRNHFYVENSATGNSADPNSANLQQNRPSPFAPAPQKYPLAMFRVPLEFSRYDVENYLTNVYNLKIKDVRTEIVTQYERKTGKSGRAFVQHLPPWKRAYVYLENHENNDKITFPDRLMQDDVKEYVEKLKKRSGGLRVGDDEEEDERV